MLRRYEREQQFALIRLLETIAYALPKGIMQKIQEITQYFAQSEMEKINRNVEELRWDKEIATKTVQIQEKTRSKRRHGDNWS